MSGSAESSPLASRMSTISQGIGYGRTQPTHTHARASKRDRIGGYAMDDHNHHSEAVIGFGSAPVAKLGSLETFAEVGGTSSGGNDPDRSHTHRLVGSRRGASMSKKGASRKVKVRAKAKMATMVSWDMESEDVTTNFGRPPVSAVGVKGVLEAKRTRSSPHIQEYHAHAGTSSSSYLEAGDDIDNNLPNIKEKMKRK